MTLYCCAKTAATVRLSKNSSIDFLIYVDPKYIQSITDSISCLLNYTTYSFIKLQSDASRLLCTSMQKMKRSVE